MKDLAAKVLNTAASRGASYAELRLIDERNRSLGTKNGKISTASDSESMGMGVRVIADGAWGFAATEELTADGIEACAALAVQIAKASAKVKAQELRLAPEKPAKVEWSSPCAIDPFAISIEQNLDLLLEIDRELQSVSGVTLAETNL